ncbi:MAG: Protein-L-isoaspartate O-methyltransferase [Phycisphaerae bacterium]|nr:Protein-L-isoaspartate O-methyltransferase [Phycisphaerae bacterium]
MALLRRQLDWDAEYARLRAAMVESQLAARGIRDPRVLRAMSLVPRERFVAPPMRSRAYDDSALSIAGGQTISQPYMVALMSQLLALAPGSRVLEIGTGSGYQTAVLADLVGCRDDKPAGCVFTVERLSELQQQARLILDGLGYRRVAYRVGDGSGGWPEEAPFDAILLTAYAPRPPAGLLEQLAVGGRFVGPIGSGSVQTLTQITRGSGTRDFVNRDVLQCRFVPMIGRDGVMREEDAPTQVPDGY